MAQAGEAGTTVLKTGGGPLPRPHQVWEVPTRRRCELLERTLGAAGHQSGSGGSKRCLEDPRNVEAALEHWAEQLLVHREEGHMPQLGREGTDMDLA